MPSPTVFDTMFRAEFNRVIAGKLPPAIARIMALAQVLSSTKRKERQSFMEPLDAWVEMTGKETDFANQILSHIDHEIIMREFGGSFQVLNTDMEDEQLSQFRNKPAELVRRGRQKASKELLRIAATADAVENWEGGGQFHAANSHIIGTGDNLLASTGAGSGTPHMVSMILDSGLKPLLWYDRKAPQMSSDVGTHQAKRNQYTEWIGSMRGAPAFGWWWDFIYDEMTGIPTAAEFQTALEAHENQFRTFQDQSGEFINEQVELTSENWVVLVRPEVSGIANQVRSNDLISLNSNRFAGRFQVMVSNDLPNA